MHLSNHTPKGRWTDVASKRDAASPPFGAGGSNSANQLCYIFLILLLFLPPLFTSPDITTP